MWDFIFRMTISENDKELFWKKHYLIVDNFVEDKTKNIVEGGRPAFTLFFNGTEIMDTTNNLPIFFNSLQSKL